MKTLIILTMVLVFSVARSEKINKEHVFYTNSLMTKIDFSLHNGVRFIGDQKSIAIKVINRVHSTKHEIKFSYDGRNPVVTLCHEFGGKHDFLYSSSKDQIPACGFNDKSFFVAWDLFKEVF